MPSGLRLTAGSYACSRKTEFSSSLLEKAAEMARTLKSDWILFMTTLGLVLSGVVMVFSSSAVIAEDTFGDPNHFALRHVVAACLGLVGMFGLMHVDYRIYRQPAVVLSLIAGVIGMLVLAYLLPPIANTHRWISLAGFSLQPSELGKLGLVVFVAYYLSARDGQVNDWRTVLIPVGTMSLLMIGLVVAQPDLGTAILMATVVGALMFAGGLNFRWMCLGGLPACFLAVALMLFEPYRLRRLVAFLDPSADPLGAGFQLNQSLISVGTGGITGVGFMEGQQKLFYLPEPHTDFIFAVIGEELGLLGTLAVLLLLAVFTWRGLRSALRAQDAFGCYLATGITLTIALQASIHMGVVLGMLPTTGVPLPFLSHGGTSILVTLASVGVLMNISQSPE
jgi:cell division protein FtsW